LFWLTSANEERRQLTKMTI